MNHSLTISGWSIKPIKMVMTGGWFMIDKNHGRYDMSSFSRLECWICDCDACPSLLKRIQESPEV